MASRGSPGLVIRRATRADADRLVEIEQKAFAPGYYRDHRLTAREFIDLAARPRIFFIVATHRGKVIGNLIGELPARPSRRHARLDSIAVDPSRQHRGAGRRLAQRFVAAARRAGYSAVVLEVATPNIGARRLFESLGFRRQRRLASYYSGRVDAIRLKKELR